MYIAADCFGASCAVPVEGVADEMPLLCDGLSWVLMDTDATEVSEDGYDSDTEFDARRRLLLGTSGEVPLVLSAPFPFFGRFSAERGCRSPSSKT